MKKIIVKDLELNKVENIKEYLVNKFNIMEFPTAIEVSGKFSKEETPINKNSGVTVALHDSLSIAGILGVTIIVWCDNIVKDEFVTVSSAITDKVLDYIEKENNLHLEQCKIGW